MSVTAREQLEKERHAAAAAERYHSTALERHAIDEQLQTGVRFPDSLEAIAARATRLLDRGAVVLPGASGVAVRGELPDFHERVVGVSTELQAWNFLPRGARAASTVARISIRHGGRVLPHGTGFLVSPRLLMTNHHVLPDASFARRCFVEFNVQVSIDNAPEHGLQFEFDPDTFFVAYERLDFALVAVHAAADGAPVGEVFGWNRLSVDTGKLVLGEPVNIIGHPSGRLKEIAVRNNTLQLRLDHFLHYSTDTEPGNSGSPVFNDQWEVVALHHSGVPETDDRGRILRKDGQVWQAGDGVESVNYVSNEGVRISSVLKYLSTVRFDPMRRELLAEMGPETGLPQGVGIELVASGHARVDGPAEAAASVGLRPRSPAFGGRRHLLFLHGRSQRGRDPEKLRREWTAGLNHGLTRAGFAGIRPEDVWFPFYGDLLSDIMERRNDHSEVIDGTATAANPDAFAAKQPASYEALIVEAACKAGMPLDKQPTMESLAVVKPVHWALSWLAAKTDLDALTIALIFRDVDAYLHDSAVREAVIDCVLKTAPPSGELVLVGHSLGTVIGMDLLTRFTEQLNVSLLVTAGSPLGLDSVYSRLLTAGPGRPARVKKWINIWYPADPVTIGCPLADKWGALIEYPVINSRDRAHSIEEYLTDPRGAAGIGRALHLAHS
ncbi:trypsin-like serine peptidase [Streptomyces lavendulocolor]|uniref:trypsin-like serine peptidase n=1 Tax=Streptomyces lavendulocolor TaxID=67316 RepID=UPI0033E9B1BD